ncbi:MAG: metallophosphoesterase [Alphaproteobacteria bacterium]|nr:metallophosphoesterase [Alphaproteobacteria bacterium]
MGPEVWGRKVARLPGRGVLLVSTDLHGNWKDYQTLKELYAAEEADGNDPILAFCGDLVHGPNPEMNQPGCWPIYLGTPYKDRSAPLILDFERWTREARVFSLMGNHEHAHVGGPVVPKFHPDEAAVLDEALGPRARDIHRLFRSYPLLAVSPNGVVLTHAAPRATEPDIRSFEGLRYEGYERFSTWSISDQGTLGALLWARMATERHARALLSVLGFKEGGFVAFGHDVIREGYERFSESQICVSTSFGLRDRDKRYLRLDLARRYASAAELREGVEILRLYPDPD